MTFFEAYRNFKNTPRPDVIVKKILIRDGEKIVELVKEQMQQGNRGGVRKDVARLGWYKPKNDGDPSAYAIMKHEMNARPGLGIVDLKLTGDFYSALYFDSEVLEVTSSDSKTEVLKERYGQYILGCVRQSVISYIPPIDIKESEIKSFKMINQFF
jgi:hypothetical protein